MGGDYPFRLSGGHARWSIHAMNMTNPLMQETHRGKPFVLINDRVAKRRGIEDDALVRICNDVGDFVMLGAHESLPATGRAHDLQRIRGFLFPERRWLERGRAGNGQVAAPRR